VVGEDDRDKAINIGFRRLFSYISGDNILRTEVESVEAGSIGTKISVTVPVQQARQAGGWSISFVVPSKFDEDSVPLLADSKVQIRPVRGTLMAVLQYSGRWSDENVENHKAELSSRLKDLSVAPRGATVTAYYNAPFSLPFMRRNEVMVPVDQMPVSSLSAAD
jgi:hypothetical protein